MKNFIKSVASYAVLVGVPIMCIGAISAGAYSVGRDDGEVKAMKYILEVAKESVENETR